MTNMTKAKAKIPLREEENMTSKVNPNISRMNRATSRPVIFLPAKYSSAITAIRLARE